MYCRLMCGIGAHHACELLLLPSFGAFSSPTTRLLSPIDRACEIRMSSTSRGACLGWYAHIQFYYVMRTLNYAPELVTRQPLQCLGTRFRSTKACGFQSNQPDAFPATLDSEGAHPCLPWRLHPRENVQTMVPSRYAPRRPPPPTDEKQRKPCFRRVRWPDGANRTSGAQEKGGRRERPRACGKLDDGRSRATDRRVHLSMLLRVQRVRSTEISHSWPCLAQWQEGTCHAHFMSPFTVFTFFRVAFGRQHPLGSRRHDIRRPRGN